VGTIAKSAFFGSFGSEHVSQHFVQQFGQHPCCNANLFPTRNHEFNEISDLARPNWVVPSQFGHQ
jgi:hypothetical protein